MASNLRDHVVNCFSGKELKLEQLINVAATTYRDKEMVNETVIKPTYAGGR